MASLFKKPKRNFRRHANTSDSENEKDVGSEAMDVDDTSRDSNATELLFDSAKMQPKEKKKKPASSTKEKEKDRLTVGETKPAVLSFCHEDEEDTEVFRVKKSSHSKRIAKQLKKEKKQEKGIDDTGTKDKDESEKHKSDEKNKKNAKSDSEDEQLRELNLKKLREELRTLNGDEAEALESSEDESGSIAFRSRLARGEIPDAKTIHFIRKQRLMARNTEDFIAIDNNDGNENVSSTSRLVRDDDHDKSDDDDEEDRVDFSVNNAARERQKIRDEFMAAEHGSDSDDKEEEKWEEEQIKKAVKQLPEIILQQVMNGPKLPGAAVSGPPDLSRYGPNLALPAPPVPMPAMSRNSDSSQITIESVRKRLQERLESLDTVYRGHKMALDTAQRDMEEAKTNVAACKQSSGGLEERYRFFQEMRGYVRDLVECLNEKVPSINELELRMHNLLRARATRLLQRRQQDVRDQCQDYMTNKTAGQVVMETEEEQAKQRRVAEREARRSRRRRTRESPLITNHHEGLSSDDEESQADKNKYKLEQENIGNAARTLFEDALEDFVDMDIVRKKFQNWKEQFGDSYREAYIALCIPKLVNPFVRLQLLDWNPLEEECQDFEDMDWHRSLIFFGGSANDKIDPEDSDIKILPTVIEKILLQKLTYLVENVWDPLSTTQTARLINLSHKLFKDYPTVASKSKPSQLYLQAVVGRVKKCLDDDVFMPLYPMSVLDSRSSGPATFFHRQSWTCIKLLGNILSWHGLLGVQLLRRLALDGLLNRYIVLGLANSHVDRHAMEKCQAIISTLPKVWFQDLQGEKTLPQLENLCRFLSKAAELVHKTTCMKGDNERQEGRLLLKLLSKQLVTIHAMDHAVTLSNQYSFKIQS